MKPGSPVRKEFQFGGHRVVLETGKIARQATGAVMATMGDTVVLCTVVANPKPNPNQDFFPLTVNYQEKFYATGKIPGGFLRREGRPSDKETLTSRLIDRPIRPLFPKGFMNAVQVIATVMSVDRDMDPDIIALIGSSAALAVSGIPFAGPIAAARVGFADGRYLLNLAEELSTLPAGRALDTGALARAVQRRMPVYDKAQDGHYNLISALHKSLRGSDVDASLYWLARMLTAGEDPLYVVRRLVRFAVEDVGLADPAALVQAIAAKDAYAFVGSPEGELAIVQLVIYLATAPKSNSAYRAESAAAEAARETGSLMPPKHILNAPTRLMKEIGYGAGYRYDHDTEAGFSGQNYFPEGMERPSLYRPGEAGFEREIRQRLDRWRELRARLAAAAAPDAAGAPEESGP